MSARKPNLLRLNVAQASMARDLLLRVEGMRAALASVTEARARMVGHSTAPTASNPLGQGISYEWTIPASSVAAQIRRDLANALRDLSALGIEPEQK